MSNLMTRVCFVLLIPYSLVNVSYSQESKTVVTVGTCVLAPDLTIGEARKKALDDAFQRAIVEVVGVNIQSETYQSKGEQLGDEKKYFDLFSEFNRSVSYGKIVRHEVLDDSVLNETLSSGETIARVRLKVSCEVAKESSAPDPSFQLKLNLNQDVFYDRGILENNDEVIVELETTQDAYLTLFGISNDSVKVLFPNQITTANKLVKGESLDFPSQNMRNAGLHFRVETAKGEKRSSEMVHAIATKDSIPFSAGKIIGGIGVVPTYQAAVDELNQWLCRIPPERRTEAYQVYEIRKK